MDIVMVRAFNHIGPGQSPTFAIPAFAKQIAEIEKGKYEPVIYTGNLEAKRDFTDVRDIVRGYWELLGRSRSGEIYNIGSGKSYAIGDLLDRLISMSRVQIDIQIDPQKVRPVDIPELRADITKIQNDIHWQPMIDIDKTLSDTLDYWRAKC
jgi:GDP-4-dehydro-6-deoxy-D-mannose reductase